MTTLKMIAGGSDEKGGTCRTGDCPTIYETDDYTELPVQGWEIDNSDTIEALRLPSGEFAVRVPKDVILEAADHIRTQKVQ